MTMAVLSTNVYQDDAEFKSYADKQFREDKLFEINGKTEKVYEYGSPISYAADYDVIDNEPVNAFRQKQIDRITADYKAAQESAEAQRAEENKDNKKYKAPAEALILSSATYQSDNGAVSIVISTEKARSRRRIWWTQHQPCILIWSLKKRGMSFIRSKCSCRNIGRSVQHILQNI